MTNYCRAHILLLYWHLKGKGFPHETILVMIPAILQGDEAQARKMGRMTAEFLHNKEQG